MLYLHYHKIKNYNNMKKIFILLMFVLSLQVNGQVARKILFEEFSGENCGPCASVWPSVKSLLDANTSKMILCKYMVAIPSAGSMCTLWAPVTTRQSYYTVNSAPFAKLDGAVIDASQTSPNHPGYLTQAIINARAAIQSPISITVNHTFDATASSVNISYNVKNETPSAISGTYVIQMALIESLVTYSTPPGTNGETTFDNVVRLMDPNTTNGTSITLPASGVSTTGTATMTIPNYVKSKTKLKILVWVQNTATKEVIQSELGSSVIPANFEDVAVKFDLTGANPGLCDATFTPKIRIYNTGSKVATTSTIQYGMTGSMQTYSHATAIPIGDSSAVITLNPVTLIPNQKSVISIGTVTVNGNPDGDAGNNQAAFSIFTTKSLASSLPFVQDFETGTTVGSQVFSNGATSASTATAYIVDKSVAATPPADFGGYGASLRAFRFRPYNASFFEEQFNVYLDKINLSGLTGSDKARMSYHYAYTKSTASTADSFVIDASKDCGKTWTRIKSKSSDEMKTAADKDPNTAFFYPTATEWKTDSFDISSFNGSAAVMIKITYKVGPILTDPGNNFYLDNINIKKIGNSPSVLSIIKDSVMETRYKANTLPLSDSIVDFYSYYTGDVNVGSKVTWKVQSSSIPANWKFVSICDNFNCYTFSNTLGASFIDSARANSNFLKAEIIHRRNPGYGYAIIRTWVNSDSVNTAKNTKLSLLVSNSASIGIVSDVNDKLLYYFDNKLFVDRDFKNAQIQVVDINGREIMGTTIQSDNIDFTPLTNGIYIARVIKDGQVAKTIKFSTSK
jgi:hypothetical protein